MADSTRNDSFGPLILAGALFGIGLGGFVEAILFQDILQWNSFFSAKLPPESLENVRQNAYAEGLYRAGLWLFIVLGAAALWAAGARRDVPWSGRALLGAILLGMGLHNVVEGVVAHHILGIHHVNEFVDGRTQATWDYGFLAVSLLILVAGIALIRGAQTAHREESLRLGAGHRRDPLGEAQA